MRRVDLRSDTVTQPTAEMREAISVALVGDDGFGEDPTVNELETAFATLVGKPAAVFVPSGVMANQMAVRSLTRPGDVVVAGRSQHLVSFEMGASARNSGVQFATVPDDEGVLGLDDVLEIIDAEVDHQPHVGLVAVENTHMPSGGIPWPAGALDALARAIAPIPIHLDGARLFNAVAATGISAADYSAPATTVSVCLSKGLCAPVGSLLAGPREVIDLARIERKRLGGAMRQAGFLAAAGLIALERVDQLRDDHRRARVLANAVAAAFPESNYDPATCQTNIVAFNHPRARELVTQLSARGVESGTIAPRRVRLVTHAQISDEDVDFVVEALSDVAKR